MWRRNSLRPLFATIDVEAGADNLVCHPERSRMISFHGSFQVPSRFEGRDPSTSLRMTNTPACTCQNRKWFEQPGVCKTPLRTFLETRHDTLVKLLRMTDSPACTSQTPSYLAPVGSLRPFELKANLGTVNLQLIRQEQGRSRNWSGLNPVLCAGG